jgi:hypothetical protein
MTTLCVGARQGIKKNLKKERKEGGREGGEKENSAVVGRAGAQSLTRREARGSSSIKNGTNGSLFFSLLFFFSRVCVCVRRL